MAGLCAGAALTTESATRFLVIAARACACIRPALHPRPDWAQDMAGPTPPPPDRLAACLTDLWPLARMQHGTLPPSPPPASPEWLHAAWSLIRPPCQMMETGGDERLDPDPTTQLNRYGTCGHSRPDVLAFSSSTASFPSPLACTAMEAAWFGLMQDLAHQRPSTSMAELRAFVAAHFGADSAGHVVMAASGTDCSLAALALCAMGGATVSTILPGAEETGSGVPMATLGRHFAHRTARGIAVEPGRVIAGFAAHNLCIAIPLRTQAGTLRAEAAVQAACAQAVTAALAQGHRVLLYLLDVSKTGLMAPAPDTIRALQALDPARVDVLVDGCQARLTPAHVRAYLAQGWAVMVTGSKFFAGPAFCGALLLPEHWRARLETGALPSGLADYAHQNEWPPLPAAQATLPMGLNSGLVLRWTGARAEMAAFAAVPARARRVRLGRFLSGVEHLLRQCPCVLPVTAASPRRAHQDDTWAGRQSIFSFLILAPGGAGVLDMPRSRLLHRWLQADLAACLPPHKATLAAMACYVGQPVAMTHPQAPGGVAGALRIAASARHAATPQHDPAGFIDSEISKVGLVLDKIALILRHWDSVARHNPAPTLPLAPDTPPQTAFTALRSAPTESKKDA